MNWDAEKYRSAFSLEGKRWETGAVVLIDSKSVYDVGKAINPELARSQWKADRLWA